MPLMPEQRSDNSEISAGWPAPLIHLRQSYRLLTYTFSLWLLEYQPAVEAARQLVVPKSPERVRSLASSPDQPGPRACAGAAARPPALQTPRGWGRVQNTAFTCTHMLRMPLSVKSRFRNLPAGVPTTFVCGTWMNCG